MDCILYKVNVLNIYITVNKTRQSIPRSVELGNKFQNIISNSKVIENTTTKLPCYILTCIINEPNSLYK